MKCKFVFEIEMEDGIATLEDAVREARSIRDTYFKPETFSGLVIHTEGDDETVSYELTDDDQVVQVN